MKKTPVTKVWSDIHGWFDYQGFYDFIIDRLLPGEQFIEVGSWLGRSVAYVATRIRNEKRDIRLISIDRGGMSDRVANSEFVRATRIRTTTGPYINNLLDCGLLPFVTHIVGDSAKTAQLFADGSVAFCYIDASHDYVAVRQDILAWLPKIKPGGICAGHDYLNEGAYKGVVRAVNGVFDTTNCLAPDTEHVWAVIKETVGGQSRFTPLRERPAPLQIPETPCAT